MRLVCETCARQLVCASTRRAADECAHASVSYNSGVIKMSDEGEGVDRQIPAFVGACGVLMKRERQRWWGIYMSEKGSGGGADAPST